MPTVAQCQRIKEQLLGQRQPREARLRELKKFICPYRGNFTGRTEDNPSQQEMLRFTRAASSASLRAASGMTSGMTPSNAPWFKTAFADANLIELSGARAWLDSIDEIIADTLTAGGFYQAIQAFNLDLIWSGSALLFAEADEECTVRYTTEQQGTWAVALNQKGRLRMVVRSLAMTAQDLADAFGGDVISRKAKQRLAAYSQERFEIWHLTMAASECQDEPQGPHPWLSLWREQGASNFLCESGYYEMPFFFTCWHEGITAYGTGPGDDALPDARQMDKMERQKLEGIAKIVSPPVVAPHSMKGTINLAPNGLNFTDEQMPIRPVYDLTPVAQAVAHLREEIVVLGERLDDALLASVFASMPLSQRPAGMSATEFLERKRESLQQLGPVISAYEPHVLVPLLFRTIQCCDRAGLAPIPPQSLAGADLLLQMQFISPMANALRQTSAETARALFQDAVMIAQGANNPEALDKIDVDQLIDELATGIGAPGSIVRSDEQVAQLREQRKQAQAQQQSLQEQLSLAQGQATQAQAMRDEAQAAQMLAAMEGGI